MYPALARVRHQFSPLPGVLRSNGFCLSTGIPTEKTWCSTTSYHLILSKPFFATRTLQLRRSPGLNGIGTVPTTVAEEGLEPPTSSESC